MHNEYEGPERRSCAGCQNIDALERRVEACKEEFDAQIDGIQSSVVRLGSDVAGLRQDVHSLGESVEGMGKSVVGIEANLHNIANTLQQLADFPETWTNLKGFLAVSTWLRQNLVVLAIVVAVLVYIIKASWPFPVDM